MSTTQEYAELFPKEVREAAKSLSTDNHFAVLALLIKEEEGQSFSQIKGNLDDLHQQSISNILTQLQEGGYVVRKDVVDSERAFSTKYEVTTLGERVLEGLLDAFEPKSSETMKTVEASGHDFHTRPNPYPFTVRNKKKVSSGTYEEASRVGGLEGSEITLADD